jgi:hypothetical protein
MNWRQLIADLYEARPQQPGMACKPKFCRPASPQDIADAEARLNAKFPVSLRSLLLDTDGAMEMIKFDGGKWHNSMRFPWKVAEIVDQNLFYRTKTETYHRDFRKLVFFSDAGVDGILFGFSVMKGRVCAPGVVVWHPIEDELKKLAPSLEDFLSGWLKGTISI